MANINYHSLLNQALWSIVRNVLKQIVAEGVDNGQSFYISFRTDDPGVVLSERIKLRYPREITIVLQHQFRDLEVFEDYFSVNISFDGISENVRVPMSALTNFIDPEGDFNLQLNTSSLDVKFTDFDEEALIRHLNYEFSLDADYPVDLSRGLVSKQETKKQNAAHKKPNHEAEVISFEQFRQKRNKKNDSA
jgi:hypothetical protein